jgi:hypothetical protein
MVDGDGRDRNTALLRPAILDRDVTALDPAQLSQSLHKSDTPHPLGLLRTRSKRPSNRRAAEGENELAPFHRPMPSVAA